MSKKLVSDDEAVILADMTFNNKLYNCAAYKNNADKRSEPTIYNNDG